MPELGITQASFASYLGVSRLTVSEILNEKRGISALMALRLARYFGCSAELWLGLQQDFELDQARDLEGPRVELEVLPRAS